MNAHKLGDDLRLQLPLQVLGILLRREKLWSALFLRLDDFGLSRFVRFQCFFEAVRRGGGDVGQCVEWFGKVSCEGSSVVCVGFDCLSGRQAAVSDMQEEGGSPVPVHLRGDPTQSQPLHQPHPHTFAAPLRGTGHTRSRLPLAHGGTLRRGLSRLWISGRGWRGC